MSYSYRFFSAGAFALLSAFSQQTLAMPNCASASSDIDGDGYGWENNTSCVVTSSASTGSGTTASGTQLTSCMSASSDPDGDGYGWENGGSCVVATGNRTSTPSPAGRNSCLSSLSDPDGDGYGWEDGASCVVDSTSSSGGGNTSGSGSSDGGQSGNLAGSGSSDGGQINNPLNDPGLNNSGSTGSEGNLSIGNPGGLIRSSTLLPVKQRPQDTCLTRDDTLNRNYHGAIRMGDFMLATNAWNAGAAGSFDWEQCIYASENGAAAGWNYNWGAGGGSGDYFVRSYPELIYGVKSQGEISAPKSVTGLPARIDQLPFISIDYSFSSSEYGPSRTVNASNNPRFPNGSIISGERNIAVESFLHPSDASGNCPASVVQRSDGQSNHTYEVMVWLDSGAERLPAGPSDFVTSVNLDGSAYNVFTKNSDRKYIAFVAQNPQTSGTINWTTFIEWARQYAHRVQQTFGANTNSVQIQNDWCLANILVGTEIFWGAGNLDIINWQVNQY